MDILLRELIPFKGISHYERYFHHYPPESEENVLMFNRSEKIKKLNWILVIYSIHSFYLFIFKPTIIDKQIKHYDFINLANIPYENGALILVYGQVIYFMDLL